MANDDSLRITYLSMGDLVSKLDEPDEEIEEDEVCQVEFDVFGMLERLQLMSDKSVDGVFPEELELPLPLDVWDAKDWVNGEWPPS